MSGVDLAREAKRLRDGIKVLLTSGYATDVLARHQAPDGFPFIRKPFYRAELAGRVWAVMREPRECALLDVSNALHEAQPWGRSGVEPPLSDVLADPLVQVLMRRDGVSRTELESIIARATEAATMQPSLTSCLGRTTRGMVHNELEFDNEAPRCTRIS
jgi:hypothetical protein